MSNTNLNGKIYSVYIKDRPTFDTIVDDTQKLWYQKTGQSATIGEIIFRGLLCLKTYLQNDYLINKPDPIHPSTLGRVIK